MPGAEAGEIAGRYAYRLNGHIGTDEGFSFRYGFAAARIKFPRLRGQHGSFWMQPVGGMYPGGTGHEIDVTEFFGARRKRSGLFSYIHRYEGRPRRQDRHHHPGHVPPRPARRLG